MKNYLFKTTSASRRNRIRTSVCIILSAILIAPAVLAAELVPPPAEGNEPILIKADQLVIDSVANRAVFSGNARAVQGETVVTADKLTIVSSKGKDGQSTATQPATDLQNIERIEAEGHVIIEFDKRVATTEKAVYHTVGKKLVLTGTGTKVVSGQDQVVGSIITFYREIGRIECVGDEKNQVKATVHSTERGLN